MECPFCGESNTGVIDSRPTKDKISIRRRRQCLACARRFTTYEATADQLIMLWMSTHGVKGGGMRDSDAVLSYMSEAFEGLSAECKRLIGKAAKPTPVKRVERKLRVKAKKKAPAKKIAVPKRKRAKKLSDTDKVLQAIRGYKKGVDIPKLKKKTGFADSKLRAIVYRANKEGKIKRLSRGVYTSA
jgi:transcriptional repressor NrdR